MSMKNSNDAIGNRTHGISVYSAVPQPLCHVKHVAAINNEQYNKTVSQVCICLFIVHAVKGCMVQRLKYWSLSFNAGSLGHNITLNLGI
jgi:hypothetical protein